MMVSYVFIVSIDTVYLVAMRSHGIGASKMQRFQHILASIDSSLIMVSF